MDILSGEFVSGVILFRRGLTLGWFARIQESRVSLRARAASRAAAVASLLVSIQFLRVSVPHFLSRDCLSSIRWESWARSLWDDLHCHRARASLWSLACSQVVEDSAATLHRTSHFVCKASRTILLSVSIHLSSLVEVADVGFRWSQLLVSLPLVKFDHPIAACRW